MISPAVSSGRRSDTGVVDERNEDPSRDAQPPLDAVIEKLSQQIENSPAADSVTASTIPAGHPPPSPDSLDDVGIAHAINGDGTALCNPELAVEQVDDYYWHDIPKDQRCSVCTATLGS